MPRVETLAAEMPRKGMANAVLHLGFVVAGIVTILLGPILPILIVRWAMSDLRAGLFFALQFCGNLAGIASLGALISRRGYRLTLVVGFTSIALGTAALYLGSEFVGLMATAIFGYGLGLVLSGTNLWVAEIAALRRAAALSVLNVAWGIGAIACAPLVMLAQKSHRLAPLLFGVAGFSAFVAMALAAMDIEPRSPKGRDAPPQSALPTVGKQTAFALGGLFFLYVGTETSVGGWAASFARRTTAAPGHAWELAPMFFWTGLLVGRALVPAILRRVRETALVAGGLILAGISNGAFLRVKTFSAAALCVTAAGLGLACIYPLLVAWMVGHYGKQARRTGTIMFGLAALGGATLPWLVGLISTHAGSLRAGLCVPLIACLVMISLLGLLREPSPT